MGGLGIGSGVCGCLGAPASSDLFSAWGHFTTHYVLQKCWQGGGSYWNSRGLQPGKSHLASSCTGLWLDVNEGTFLLDVSPWGASPQADLFDWHCMVQPHDVNECFKGSRKGSNDIRWHDTRAWAHLKGCRALQQQAKDSQQIGQGLKTCTVIWKLGLMWSTAQAIMVTHLPASTSNRFCCGRTELLHLSNTNTTLWSECFLFYFPPEEMSPPKDVRCSPKRTDEITKLALQDSLDAGFYSCSDPRSYDWSSLFD